MLAERFECSLADYHAMADSWSHSQIEVLIESPPLFHGRFISRIFPREGSEALDVGTICHQALTDPGGLDSVLAIIPDAVLNGDGHRKGNAWKDWTTANAEKIQMKRSEADPIFHMVQNVCYDPRASLLLDAPGPFEGGIRWLDDPTGLTLRARPDKVSYLYGEPIVVDIKTTRATTPRRFAADCFAFGYHRQAAWYAEGLRELGEDPVAFVFIVVDKTPAHECTVYELDPKAIELGHQQNRVAIDELARRLETGDWDSRQRGKTLLLDLPTYAYRDDPWEVRAV